MGIPLASLLCLSLFKSKNYRKSNRKLLKNTLLFLLSLLLTAIQIELTFFPIIIFFVFIICWIVWAINRSQIRDNELTFLNIMIISWMVLSLIVTLGQFLDYSSVVISEVYAFNVSLDLRISLILIITAIILITSLGKIDRSKIETTDLLLMKNDKGNPILIIVGLFFVLANFLIQIGWWLGSVVLLWGQECVIAIKMRIEETKNTLFDLSIILICILGLFTAYKLSQSIVLEYLPINSLVKEIAPFISIVGLSCIILFAAYLIIRIRYVSWSEWNLTLNKSDFSKADREYREAIAFPILTSGISGILLFGLSSFTTLDLIYFKNYGFFSLFLTVGLLAAIVITLFKHFSNAPVIKKIEV